jgi:hypothetical protein
MTTNAQIDQVTALLRVGEMAMQMYRADVDAKATRDAYHDRIQEYEEIFNDGERIRPMSDEVRQYTQEEFLAFDAAKKKAYRAKSKLLKACADLDGGAQ